MEVGTMSAHSGIKLLAGKNRLTLVVTSVKGFRHLSGAFYLFAFMGFY